MILAIRTDKPEAELYLLENESVKDELKWLAHRELADTLLLKIKVLLEKNKLSLDDLGGIIIFTGEGSFTGLRIGTSVANALAYGLGISIAEGKGSKWINEGLKNLEDSGNNKKFVIPSYDAKPNITKPKRR